MQVRFRDRLALVLEKAGVIAKDRFDAGYAYMGTRVGESTYCHGVTSFRVRLKADTTLVNPA